MERSAKHFLVIKAARELKKEIEKAGLDNLKILADAGTSIVATYLQGCSPHEKAKYRRDLKALVQLGVTPDMVLSELAKQIPALAPIMKGRETYKQSELQQIAKFMKEL
jgi:hypothetical protein